jgi:hypothetical protein
MRRLWSVGKQQREIGSICQSAGRIFPAGQNGRKAFFSAFYSLGEVFSPMDTRKHLRWHHFGPKEEELYLFEIV